MYIYMVVISVCLYCYLFDNTTIMYHYYAVKL